MLGDISQTHLNDNHMQYLGSILGISWQGHVPNKDVSNWKQIHAAWLVYRINVICNSSAAQVRMEVISPELCCTDIDQQWSCLSDRPCLIWKVFINETWRVMTPLWNSLLYRTGSTWVGKLSRCKQPIRQGGTLNLVSLLFFLQSIYVPTVSVCLSICMQNDLAAVASPQQILASMRLLCYYLDYFPSSITLFPIPHLNGNNNLSLSELSHGVYGHKQ